VTVVRNDLAGLQKSRSSLEEQSYKNWIHIIVDGASTDGTLQYIKSLPSKNTVYISEPDTGIYNAMNKAWRLATGESFVFFLNARDVFAGADALTAASQALESTPSSKWGCTTHEEIREDGSGWVCKLVSPPSVSNQLYAFGYRSHQAVVMQADFISLLGGFDENYRIAADWDLIVKALLVAAPAVWSKPIARFELGGMSSDNLLEAHMELRAIRTRVLKLSWSKRVADDLWCAIYLRLFGFKNYFTPIINLAFPGIASVNPADGSIKVQPRKETKFRNLVVRPVVKRVQRAIMKGIRGILGINSYT
jgi:glycosyltransferase involved in cell wall biosynthesis